MGLVSLGGLQSSVLVLAGCLVVFGQVAFQGFRAWTGTQFDLLPALLVYASLTTDLKTICWFAILCGLSSDALSMNPLGTSVLPLGTVGVGLHLLRGLLVREQVNVQVLLGFCASGLVPMLNLAMTVAGAHYRAGFADGMLEGGASAGLEWPGALGPWGRWQPVLHWTLSRHCLIQALSGALATPLLFLGLRRLLGVINYPVAKESYFRTDREMKRGRS